jgi:hypothetical protein
VEADGVDQKIFNWSNSYLFSHELLNGFTRQFTRNPTPFTAFVDIIKDNYIDNHSPFPFIHVATFQKVWFTFVQLQSYGNHLYCPSCKSSTPDVVIVDGVTISLPRQLLHPRVSPPTQTTDASPMRPGTWYIPLIMLRPQTRTLLQRWAGAIHKRDKVDKFKTLEAHEKDLLIRKLEDRHGDNLPELVQVMKWCIVMERNGNQRNLSIAHTIREFIRVIAAGDPIMQAFPPR